MPKSSEDPPPLNVTVAPSPTDWSGPAFAVGGRSIVSVSQGKTVSTFPTEFVARAQIVWVPEESGAVVNWRVSTSKSKAPSVADAPIQAPASTRYWTFAIVLIVKSVPGPLGLLFVMGTSAALPVYIGVVSAVGSGT